MERYSYFILFFFFLFCLNTISAQTVYSVAINQPEINIIEAECYSGTSEIKNSDLIKIYPNPFSDYTTITIHVNFIGNCSLSIYDNTGHKLFTDLVTNENYVLNRNSLAAGLYFIEIKGDKTFINRVLIID